MSSCLNEINDDQLELAATNLFDAVQAHFNVRSMSFADAPTNSRELYRSLTMGVIKSLRSNCCE